MNVDCVWEHNGDDSLMYAANFIGAFTRGASKEEALAKMPLEIRSYRQWRDGIDPIDEVTIQCTVVEEKLTALCVSDADSEVLFCSERPPIDCVEYEKMKGLVIQSAKDFQRLFEAIPDKNRALAAERSTFYGKVPVTARHMYEHVKGVNHFYFGQIGIDTSAEADFVSCRQQAFAQLEGTQDFLSNRLFIGSDEEKWTLRKVCRRFIWHDRIHAKALYRRARKVFEGFDIPNIFYFR